MWCRFVWYLISVLRDLLTSSLRQKKTFIFPEEQQAQILPWLLQLVTCLRDRISHHSVISFVLPFAPPGLSESPEHRDSVRCAGFSLHLLQLKAQTALKPQPSLNVTNESQGTSPKTMLCYCLPALHTNLVCPANLTPLWALVWIKVFGTRKHTGFYSHLADRTKWRDWLYSKEVIHCKIALDFLSFLKYFCRKENCVRKVTETKVIPESKHQATDGLRRYELEAPFILQLCTM